MSEIETPQTKLSPEEKLVQSGKLTSTQVAEIIGCSSRAVSRFLKQIPYDCYMEHFHDSDTYRTLSFTPQWAQKLMQLVQQKSKATLENPKKTRIETIGIGGALWLVELIQSLPELAAKYPWKKPNWNIFRYAWKILLERNPNYFLPSKVNALYRVSAEYRQSAQTDFLRIVEEYNEWVTSRIQSQKKRRPSYAANRKLKTQEIRHLWDYFSDK